MAVINSLLIRWLGGYIQVNDNTSIVARGQKEGFLQVGSVATREEVDRIAAAFLALHAAPTVATAMGVEPTGVGDEPFVDYSVGDTVTAPEADGSTAVQLVASMTVAEDDNGEVTFAPELKDSFVVQDEQFNRQLKRLLQGTMKGASQSASPVPPSTVTNT